MRPLVASLVVLGALIVASGCAGVSPVADDGEAPARSTSESARLERGQEGQLDRAIGALFGGDHDEARDGLQELLAELPNHPRVLFTLANVELEAGRLEEASRLAEAVASTATQDEDATLPKGATLAEVEMLRTMIQARAARSPVLAPALAAWKRAGRPNLGDSPLMGNAFFFEEAFGPAEHTHGTATSPDQEVALLLHEAESPDAALIQNVESRALLGALAQSLPWEHAEPADLEPHVRALRPRLERWAAESPEEMAPRLLLLDLDLRARDAHDWIAPDAPFDFLIPELEAIAALPRLREPERFQRLYERLKPLFAEAPSPEEHAFAVAVASLVAPFVQIREEDASAIAGLLDTDDRDRLVDALLKIGAAYRDQRTVLEYLVGTVIMKSALEFRGDEASLEEAARLHEGARTPYDEGSRFPGAWPLPSLHRELTEWSARDELGRFRAIAAPAAENGGGA